jgi:glutamine synthetase
VHVSLLEQDGANLFARDGQALGHAIAGLQATMAETMLVCAPTPTATAGCGR